MPARTGVSTPWKEWTGDATEAVDLWDESGHHTTPTVYFRDGWLIGEVALLVEAIRADGVSLNIGDGYRRVETAIFVPALYGYVDGDDEPTRCDQDGCTSRGEYVDATFPCVFAIMT